MVPKRSPPNRIPVDGAYERSRITQLEQHVAHLAEQIATLLANQNPFQGLNTNSGGYSKFEESDEEEFDPSLFYNDTYLLEEAFVDFDQPPIFDEEIFEKESVSNLGFMDYFCES